MADILKLEIPGDMKRSKPDSLEPPKVMILCQDTRTCYQLKQFLTQGGERFLLYNAMRHQIPIGKLSNTYAKVQSNSNQDICSTQATSTSTKDLYKNSNKSLTEPKVAELEDEEETQLANTQVDELTQLLNAGDADQLDANDFQESYMLTMTQAQFDNMS